MINELLAASRATRLTGLSILLKAQSGIIDVHVVDRMTVARRLATMYTRNYEDMKLNGLGAGSAIVKEREQGASMSLEIGFHTRSVDCYLTRCVGNRG